MNKVIEKELTVEQEVTQDCPILFQMRYKPCTETCMCWGFECNEGWHMAIADACRELEMLNDEYYPKYRVRIQADQIKEKFGTLRFYWTLARDPNRFYVWLGHKFESIADFLHNHKKFDYKMKKIVDVPPHDYDDKREIDKESYDKKVNDKYKPNNVEYIEENGKYFEICHLHYYGKIHYEPTKHKILWKIMNACNSIKQKLLYSTPRRSTAKIRNCIAYMNRRAEKIIRDLEVECESICEKCGHQIGTDWSPACQTLGWITYICDDCAEKSGNNYIKNGELWNGKNRLKTKEELRKKQKNVTNEEKLTDDMFVMKHDTERI